MMSMVRFMKTECGLYHADDDGDNGDFADAESMSRSVSRSASRQVQSDSDPFEGTELAYVAPSQTPAPRSTTSAPVQREPSISARASTSEAPPKRKALLDSVFTACKTQKNQEVQEVRTKECVCGGVCPLSARFEIKSSICSLILFCRFSQHREMEGLPESHAGAP